MKNSAYRFRIRVAAFVAAFSLVVAAQPASGATLLGFWDLNGSLAQSAGSNTATLTTALFDSPNIPTGTLGFDPLGGTTVNLFSGFNAGDA